MHAHECTGCSHCLSHDQQIRHASDKPAATTEVAAVPRLLGRLAAGSSNTRCVRPGCAPSDCVWLESLPLLVWLCVCVMLGRPTILEVVRR